MKSLTKLNWLGTTLLAAAIALPSGAVFAQESGKTLQDLLKAVREENSGDKRLNKQREDEFRSNLEKLRGTLGRAQQERARQEAESSALEAKFQENEKVLTQLQARLDERQGTLGELFGVFRQVAGDTREVLKSSMTTAQYNGRVEAMDKLASAQSLPKVSELKQLWETLLGEMTYTGEVSKFQTSVVLPNGNPEQTTVVRVGPFSAVADGQFLVWDPDTQALKLLERQPAARHLSAASDILDASPGELTAMSVDPSRGTILGLLVSAPDFMERVDQGGLVGYVIMVLGLAGALILLYRLLALSTTGSKMRAQIKSTTPNMNNPLGRVMSVYEQNKDVDVETLELKLDETIIKEVPVLEGGLSTLKVLSVIAPLLGLLGTVTGMIITFQQITLFGTGDPKLMAGGISTALVTTTQGLIVAIPMVLAHSFLRDRSKSLVQILEEQAAGMIAQRAERESSGAGKSL